MTRANMLSRHCRATPKVLGAILTSAVIAGCQDGNSGTRGPLTAGAPTTAAYARITPAEFHRRNSMSFIAAMNTEFMQKTTAKMIATKKLPRTRDLCAEARHFFEAHQRPEWTALPRAVREQAFAGACEKLRPLTNTKPRGRVRTVAAFQSHDPDYDVGPDFHMALENMITDASQASDLNDLASRYAVILSSTQGMRWIDSIGIEVMLGLAMSQAEYFWDGSVLQAYINQVTAEYDACAAGTGQDVYIELDEGRLLECDGGQMWETNARRRLTRPQIRLARYDRSEDPTGVHYTRGPAPLPDCNATMGQRVWRAFGWAMGGGGIGFTAGSIAGAIGGAAGGVAGAMAGAKAGGATGGAAGVVLGALSGVIFQAGDFVYCLREL